MEDDSDKITITSISNDENCFCALLKINTLSILLDCPLNLSKILHFTPPTIINKEKKRKLSEMEDKKNSSIKLENNQVLINGDVKYETPHFDMIDMEKVDAIIISNYYNMLSLPYITEYTSFKGSIFATEPTLRIGEQMLRELVSFDKSSKTSTNFTEETNWSDEVQYQTNFKDSFLYAFKWRELYNIKDVESSIQKVKFLSFSEKIDLYSLVEIKAVSSGYCLGSSNWIISTKKEKVVYITESNDNKERHPQEMDKDALANADICIFSKVPKKGIEYSRDEVLSELAKNVGSAVSQGGNILFPTFSFGNVYELFDYLRMYLKKQGLSFVPIYFVSKFAKYSLQYSNILGEWLSESKKSRIYMPEEPFVHTMMVEKGSMVLSDNILDLKNMKEPSIVFTGSPSLRGGDVLHLLDLWKNNSKNMIVFTENGHFEPDKCIAPFCPLKMKVLNIPVDVPINENQTLLLLKTVIKPKHVVFPSPSSSSSNSSLSPFPVHELSSFCTTSFLPLFQSLHFSLAKKTHEVGELSVDLALSTRLRPHNDLLFSNVSGVLHQRDNKFYFRSTTASDPPKKKYQRIWGPLLRETLLEALKNNGVQDFEISNKGNDCEINIPSLTSQVLISHQQTTIVTDSAKSRFFLKELITSCLK